MSWNYETSKTRVEDHSASIGKITVEKLKKEADLTSLLSETNCREIYGAHMYFNIGNFPSIDTASTDNKEETKRLVRGIHIFQREVNRIVEWTEMFDAVAVHFQGPKLHALIYRPIDDGKRIATSAVMLALVLRDFTRSVFNPAFPKLENFRVASGADIGNVIGTQNGVKGDRELLFLGHPANLAAKIIGATGSHRITPELYGLLPEKLQQVCELVPDDDRGLYQLKDLTKEDLDSLCEKFGIEWDREASAKRLEDDRKLFPLSDIDIADADVLIDIDMLSITKNKRVGAASVFADLAGFTNYIDSADTEEKKEEALRVLHVLRKEFAKIATDDYNGVRIQCQGDRMQAAFHLPKGIEKKVVRKAINAAAGIQSSMKVVKECMPESENLSVAVGIDYGTTLISKLGTRGARDPICLGDAVEQAAKIEERVAGSETGMSSRACLELPEHIAAVFQWSKEKQCYVASNLDVELLDDLETAEKMKQEKTASVSRSVAGVSVIGGAASLGRSVSVSRNFAE